MAFKDFFTRLVKKKDSEPPVVPAPKAAPEPAAPRTIPYPSKPPGVKPPSAIPAPPPAGQTSRPSPPGKEEPKELEKALEMLQAIEAALGNDSKKAKGPMAEMPCSAVLKKLPEALRGEAWRPDGFPENRVHVPRQSVMDQLKRGRIAFPVAEIIADLPDGWVKADNPEAEVEFDLEQAVAHIPPEWFQLSSKVPDILIEASQMRDYFRPRPAAQQASSVAVPPPKPPPAQPSAPAPAATVEPPAAPLKEIVVPTPAQKSVSKPAIPPPGVAPAAQPATESLIAKALEPAGAKPQPRMEPTAPPLTRPPAPVELKSPTPVAPAAPVVPRLVTPPVPVAKPQRVADEGKPAVPPAAGGEWNGIEEMVDAGAKAVNINRADLEMLATLPGVGSSIAASIIEYRQQHGPFPSIYDLAEMPGIGPKLFTRMTGLTLKERRNRHAVLNQLVGLDGAAALPVATLLEAICRAIGVKGGLLSNRDGIPLANTAAMAEKADQLGALVPQMFRRSERYLRPITNDAIRCLVLPMTDPPLLLFSGEEIYLAFATTTGQPVEPFLPKALEITRELDWLMGCRAVVR